MSDHPLHVAILGAGLGGLCLAQGLQALGCRVSVFERDAALDSRPQGYRIRINQSGQAALAACLGTAATAALASARASTTPLRSFDAGLQALDKHLPAWSDRLVQGRVDHDWKMDRQAMRRAMLQGLESCVQFGMQLASVQSDGASVTLNFAHGPSQRCDLLVGADGVNSWLASHYLASAPAQDTGALCLYGRLSLAQAQQAGLAAPLLQATHAIFERQLALIIDPMQFDATGLMPSPENYLYWALIGQRHRFGLAPGAPLPQGGATLSLCCAAIAADWAPELRALFAATPVQSQALMTVRQTARIASWPTGRITALGDAVHAMSPASGLGCNTALRDAQLLCQQLQQVLAGQCSLETAIQHYESAMRVHAGAALQSSLEGSTALYAMPA
ncbi:hypothetical protein GTP23_08490 [Pseudoduganella sp. FT93W]|uniref:FAD-binding domain-containing protein n=1 Tax=Duganella fentianensis TaxID=2692177 RepID=A0A845HVP5_9BURK|nr:FAD-dependent monooxygenase [Duganella fentianensis]MYN45099.1 hypothetical protein [Duganella fentianensis]